MRVSISYPVRLGVAVLILMAAAACGQSAQSPTSPTLAQSSNAVAALASPEVPIFNVNAAGVSTDGQGPCRFTGTGGGRFDCLDHRGRNLNFTRTVTYYDASGAVQSAYDATTTASIKTVTSASGSVTTRDGGTATFNRSGTMTVTGLAGDETSRTLNGTEQGTVNITGKGAGGQTFSFNTSVTDTTTNLVVPVPRTGSDTPPLSGSRTHSTSTVTTRGSDTHTDTLVRTETFDGTNIVQVVLTINGVPQNCTNDISNHSTTCKR